MTTSAHLPCPACGTSQAPSAVECGVCGGPLGGPRGAAHGRCPRCGGPAGARDEFCSGCGLKLATRWARPPTREFRLRPPAAGSLELGAGPARPADPAAPAAAPGLPTIPPASDGDAALTAPGARRLDAPSAALGGLTVHVVERDGREHQVAHVGPEGLELGRSNPNPLLAGDPFVSPRHARLWRSSEGTVIEDLGSRNGVFVRIDRPTPVYPGDCFLLGHRLLRLEPLPMADRDPGDPDGVMGFGTPLPVAWGCLRLIVVGAQAADRYDLRGPRTVIGREDGQIVFPEDDYLSRQHACLTLSVDRGTMHVVLEDLGSHNGTYLRVRGHVILPTDAMVRIGDHLLRVRSPG